MKKNILTKILAFILFVSVCLSVISVSSLFSLYSQKSVYKAIESSSYVSQTYGALDDAYKVYANDHRISKVVFEDIVDKNKLKKDIYNSIDNSFSDKNNKIDTKKIGIAFEKRYIEYLEYNNVLINYELKELIEQSKTFVEKTYEDKVQFDFGKYFKEYKNKSSSKLIISTIIFLIFAVMSLMLLIFLSSNRIEVYRNVIYSNIAIITVLVLFKYYYEYQLTKATIGLEAYYANFIFAFISIACVPILLVAGLIGIITIILLLLIQKEKTGD